MYNKTTYYLFPLIYNSYCLKPSLIRNKDETGFELNNLYLTDSKKEEAFPLAKYLFMLLDVYDVTSERFIEFMTRIKQHNNYDSYYNPDYKKVMLIFKLDDYQRKITNLFIKGKYSQFDSDYSISFKADAAKKIDSVYNVLTKNPFLKAHLENELGVILDDDAELDSIYNPEDEIYNYIDFKIKFVNDILKNANSA